MADSDKTKIMLLTPLTTLYACQWINEFYPSVILPREFDIDRPWVFRDTSEQMMGEFVRILEKTSNAYFGVDDIMGNQKTEWFVIDADKVDADFIPKHCRIVPNIFKED